MKTITAILITAAITALITVSIFIHNPNYLNLSTVRGMVLGGVGIWKSHGYRIDIIIVKCGF